MSRRPIPRISRVGVDVGGTFTDIVLIDPCGRHPDPASCRRRPRTSAAAWPTACARSSTGTTSTRARVRDVVHGSTVATNAILERKGARTGLLTTAGFRDVLELRRLRMPRLYDMTWEKPAPLVERYAPPRGPRAGRPRRRGRHAARPRGGPRAVQALVDDGVESLAVSLLHSYANTDPRAGDRRRCSPPSSRTCGCRCRTASCRSSASTSAPARRSSTPTSSRPWRPTSGRSAASSTTRGIAGPLLIMQSNGGIMAGAAAAERPAYIVESGPAAGVIASAELARRLQHRRGHHLRHGRHDRQGLARRRRPAALHGRVRGRRRDLGQQPAVERRRLRPERAVHRPRRGRRRRRQHHLARPGAAPRRSGRSRPGADPGSGLLRQGRRAADVTDANLLLGYLNPGGLLDGAMPLDVERARARLRSARSPIRSGSIRSTAAYGCHELANASMIRAIKSVSVQRGRDPRDFTLVAFGGSGPIHAAGIARELGIRRDRRAAATRRLLGRRAAPGPPRVPRQADVPAADARARSRPSCEAQVAAPRGRRARRASASTACATARSSSRRGRRCATSARASSCRSRCRRGRELVDGLAGRAGRGASRSSTSGPTATGPGNPTEIVHLRVVARESRAAAVPDGAARTPKAAADDGRRPAYFGERVRRCARRRSSGARHLSAEAAAGPFVIEDYDATTVVPPDFTARRDGGLEHRHRGGAMSERPATVERRRRDPARADPRGSRRDLRGDGGQRHPDLALRDGQERDGLLDRPVRREGRDHRPGRDAAEPARRAARRGRGGPARVRRHARPGRRRHGQRPVRRRDAPARHLRGQAGLPRRPAGGHRGDGRPPRRPRRAWCRAACRRTPRSATRRGCASRRSGSTRAGVPEHGVFALLRANTRVPGDRARRHGRPAGRLRHRRGRAAAADRASRRGRLRRPGQGACSTTRRS